MKNDAKELGARRAALEALGGVLRRRQPLDESWSDAAAGLERRDRAFARLLAATALRRLGQLDALIAAATQRPLPRSAAVIQDILRLGLTQLIFLGTPPHAAVTTSVSLAGEPQGGRLKGLVNAVLRRLSREGPALVAAQDAARLNTPDWLWESWRRAYGEAAARRIAESHLEEPSLDLTVKQDPEGWAERLGGVALPTGTVRLPGSHVVTALEGFEEGAWWVQDAGASLPARLLQPVAGKAVLDMCAAPGGKTAQLAAWGAKVTAIDRAPGRMERLRRNLERLTLSAEMVTADAAAWTPARRFDAILLDAPCSSTGTIRRHPDIPRTKTAADVTALSALQDRLLARAAALLAPGGVLVWSTCSLQPEEGEGRIARLLESNDALERLPVNADEIGGLKEAITPDGEARVLPFHGAEWGGMDGFHIARLRRKPA